MEKQNPFSTAFGRVPKLYVAESENNIVNEIVSTLDAMTDNVIEISGIRGSGKTVTMAAVEEILDKRDDWIVIDLIVRDNMLDSLVANLYDSCDYVNKFICSNINLSAFGIGVDISTIPQASSLEVALKKILEKMKNDGKQLLIAIDEAVPSKEFVEFAKIFNMLSRRSYPINIVMTGLKKNFSALEDIDDMTFLRRSFKIELEPLNFTLVRLSYMNIFKIDVEYANELAYFTKGYPFAYQALGKLLWEEENHKLTDSVIEKFDNIMDVNCYGKLWSEFSEKEKWYLCYISKKDSLKASEVLSMTAKKAGDLSRYRDSLIKKGVLSGKQRGIVNFVLPRFNVFVQNQAKYEGRTIENDYISVKY